MQHFLNSVVDMLLFCLKIVMKHKLKEGNTYKRHKKGNLQTIIFYLIGVN